MAKVDTAMIWYTQYLHFDFDNFGTLVLMSTDNGMNGKYIVTENHNNTWNMACNA